MWDWAEQKEQAEESSNSSCCFSSVPKHQIPEGFCFSFMKGRAINCPLQLAWLLKSITEESILFCIFYSILLKRPLCNSSVLCHWRKGKSIWLQRVLFANNHFAALLILNVMHSVHLECIFSFLSLVRPFTIILLSFSLSFLSVGAQLLLWGLGVNCLPI